MIYFLFICIITVGGYFAFRYFSIRRALRDADLELQELLKDLTQNQILHLSMPDKYLEQFIHSINNALEEIKRERQSYEKREKEFQRQIENISHDLRTPLTVILGYLKYMKNAEKQTENMEETLEIMERKARAMEKLVAQFYDFSRLTSQDYEIAIQEIDVCRILREALPDNYQALAQRCLRVESILPKHPVPIKGDARALERIFSNLFQNAGRYASSFLQVELIESPSKIHIIFTNDTEELSPQDVPHLFERFYMQNRTRNQSGTGLGLTIAKSLAEAMGGTLEAELTEAAGSMLKAESELAENTKSILEVNPKESRNTSSLNVRKTALRLTLTLKRATPYNI